MMMRMTKWAGVWMAMGLVLVVSEPGVSQVRTDESLVCPEGFEEGNLGISGLSCDGECTLTLRDDGSERSWSFSTEPRVFGIEDEGPADGILEPGDLLVAIDGILITTQEGGRRYANLRPGETVDVRYRREGRVREATIHVGGRCQTRARPAMEVGRVPPLPPLPDAARPVRAVAVAPRVKVAPVRRTVGVAEEAYGLSVVSRRATAGILAGMSPTGKLGVGFSCTECGTRTNDEMGEEVWFFSGPIEVTAVNSGGPADGVGIQRGDLIRAIDGKAIDTPEGGLAFTRLTPGESVRLSIVKRNGTEAQVALIPEESTSRRGSSGVLRATSPERVAGVAVAPRVTEPLRGVPQEPQRVPVVPPPDRFAMPFMDPPEGMPIRYSGSVNGVEVEVRGSPVTVSEMRGARTLYINAEGLWIRITVPRGTAPLGLEPLGTGSSIRR